MPGADQPSQGTYARHPAEALNLPNITRAWLSTPLHPRPPTPRMLAQYMDDHWRDTVEVRGIETWDTIAYPPRAPLTSRPDWRKRRCRCRSCQDGGRGRSTLACAISATRCFRSTTLLMKTSWRNCARAQRLARLQIRLAKDFRLRGSSRASPVPGAIGGGKRAAGRRPALRAGTDVGDGRTSARKIKVLADL